MGRYLKALLWLYIGILITGIEVMAYLFWKMALSPDRKLVIAEPTDWLFYTELALMTFAAGFTFVFTYLIMLGKYRFEIQKSDGITFDEARRLRDNVHSIRRLKERIK